MKVYKYNRWIMIVLLLFAFTLQAQNNAEKELYKMAKQEKTAKLYLKYLLKYYPNGKYVQKIQKHGDDIIYLDAIKRNDYIQLLDYRNYFPQGKHKTTIHADKDKVATINLNKIIKGDDINLLERFIDQHYGATLQIFKARERTQYLSVRLDYESLHSYLKSNIQGTYYKEGLSVLFKKTKNNRKHKEYKRFFELLHIEIYTNDLINGWWNLIKDRSKISYFQDFMSITPENDYKKLAKIKKDDIIFNKVKEKNTMSAFELFISKEKDNHHFDEAKKKYFNLVVKDKQAYDQAKAYNTHTSYSAYIKNNPNGKYIDTAKKQYHALPLISNVHAEADGSKLLIHFHVETATKENFNMSYSFKEIHNDRGIDMNAISGDLSKYPESGDYTITWDVLQDTETLEGNIYFFVTLNTKEEAVAPKYTQEIGEDGEPVPFALIEEPPIFPGCYGSKSAKKKCFQKKLQEHIGKHFNADIAQELGLNPGRKRIFVQFIIDSNGRITNIRTRSPHKALKREAERVIRLLPKMTPGKQRNKPVKVPFSLPITVIVLEDD